MSWSWFIYFAVVALLLWWGGAVCALRGRRKAAVALTAAGLLVFGSFMAGMWVGLPRPRPWIMEAVVVVPSCTSPCLWILPV